MGMQITYMMAEKIDRNRKIYQLSKQGLSSYQIADKFGLRQPTVIEILKRWRKREGANQ